MARMRQALAEYRTAANADPIERLIRLRRLREEILLAQETLRIQETGRFSSSTAQGGAPAASTLLPGVQETTIEARSSGQVNEGLLRGAPGSSLEAYMTSAGALATLPGVDPALRARLAELLAGYHRAHMIGPGFGAELFEGMMMAPAVVNLRAQNGGVERFVRDMVTGGANVTVETHATGRRLIVPAEGGVTHQVDILTSIDYRIRVAVRGETRDYRVTIGVTDPPSGRPTIVVNTIPPDTPAGAMLAQMGGCGRGEARVGCVSCGRS